MKVMPFTIATLIMCLLLVYSVTIPVGNEFRANTIKNAKKQNKAGKFVKNQQKNNMKKPAP